jgi:hypothetical protein
MCKAWDKLGGEGQEDGRGMGAGWWRGRGKCIKGGLGIGHCLGKGSRDVALFREEGSTDGRWFDWKNIE